MIKNKFLAFFLGFALLFGVTSCEDYFGDVNVNPNSPTDVTPEVLLPNIQVRLAFTLGGDFSRYSSIIVQHVEGITRQWASINAYSFIVPANFNTSWRTNMYAGVLQDLNILKSKANENGFNYYAGVADVLLAYAWMSSTDVWGDMPYQEAFQGVDNLAPAFDSQEFIYQQIFALLDEADVLLAGDGGGSVPGGDDLMYAGDAAAWAKFAKAVRARASLNLALVDSKYYGDALSAASEAFESNADDARLVFGSGATSSAPWYQFNRDRGDIQIGTEITAQMTALSDPRQPIYSPDFPTFDAHPFFIPNRAFPFVTYTELEFLRAECLMQSGGSDADIHTAYVNGITSNFADLGISDQLADYLANVDPGEGSVTMNDIMIQKYLALFTEPVTFNDWRRTNIPALTPNSGDVVPVRFPYAETEILFNENTPAVTIYDDKVWWDKN